MERIYGTYQRCWPNQDSYLTLSRLSPFKALFNNGCIASAVSAFVSFSSTGTCLLAMLTDTLDLPDDADLTGANFSSLVAVDQLCEVRQERGHPKPGDDHENALVLAHRGTDSMRPTEEDPAGAKLGPPFDGLCMVKKFSSEPPSRFHEQFQLTLLFVRPRGHDKRVTLQERPETDGRNPQVDVLSSLDFQRPGQSDLDLDRAFRRNDQRSSVPVAEGPIPPQDADALDHRRREE